MVESRAVVDYGPVLGGEGNKRRMRFAHRRYKAGNQNRQFNFKHLDR